MFIDKVEEYCRKNNLNDHSFETKCNLANGTVRSWRKGNEAKLETIKRIVEKTDTKLEEWL